MGGCIRRCIFTGGTRRAVHAPKASPLGANYSALASNERDAVFSATLIKSMIEA
jgi:hypothetical protein